MLALLNSYEGETLVNSEVVDLPDNYDGDPYGDTVPFTVASNQTIETL